MNRKWEHEHPERVAIWRQRYKDNHPDKIKHSRRLAKYKRKGATGKYTKEQWEEIKVIYQFTCPICLRKEPEIELTVDHKIPIIKGGTNNIDNIQPLCRQCNSRKNAKIWFASCVIN